MSPQPHGAQPLLDQLVDEVRLAFHSLGNFAARTTMDGIDPPARAVLEFLLRHGPTTVPEIARRRGVTRQHIQTIVNDLAENSLVTAESNPAHRRSHLICLTTSGTDLIATIVAHERDLIAPFVEELDREALISSVELLSALRHHLDSVSTTTPPTPKLEASR